MKQLFLAIFLGLLATLIAEPLIRAQTVVTPAVAAIACGYTSVAPVPTTGTYFQIQCTSNGNLKVQ